MRGSTLSTYLQSFLSLRPKNSPLDYDTAPKYNSGAWNIVDEQRWHYLGEYWDFDIISKIELHISEVFQFSRAVVRRRYGRRKFVLLPLTSPRWTR
ncbi:hypothetical protein THAOC_06075, partial [Thalassiosira oceanica]